MPDYNSYNEKELLLQIASGSQEAFGKLFDQYYKKIFCHILTYTKSTTVAEEIVQDIFLKVWMNREKLTTVESFSNYLFIIARNHVISAMRMRINKPIKTFDLELIQDTVSAEQTYSRDAERVILEGIEKLPPQQKAVFNMKRMDNLSYEEIGEQLGISKHTVKYHLVTALNFLRTYIAGSGLSPLLLWTTTILFVHIF